MLIWTFLFLSRADCYKVDNPDVIPEHNGLTQFGKVRMRTLHFPTQISTHNFFFPDCDKGA